MNKSILLILLLGVLSVSQNAYAVDRLVPSQYPTIQSAIDVANPLETVLVAPGTYKGSGNTNINFRGKQITVKSQAGPNATIVDCLNNGTGFIFGSGETSQSVLDGFTITHCGAGIRLTDVQPGLTYPIIQNNIIRGNEWGILDTSPDPQTVPANRLNMVKIRKNVIEANQNIGIFYKTSVIIQNNLILGNLGQGIYVRTGDVLIENNTIVGNEGVAIESEAVDYYPNHAATINIKNSIVYKNRGSFSGWLGFGVNTLNISFSNIQDLNSLGNGADINVDSSIDSDPLFLYNFALAPNSPSKDTGDPNSDYDYDHTRIDMGVDGGPLGAPYGAVRSLVKNSLFNVNTGVDFYPDWIEDDAAPLQYTPNGPDLSTLKPDGWAASPEGQIAHEGMRLSHSTPKTSYSYQDIPIEFNKAYRVSGWIQIEEFPNPLGQSGFGTLMTECRDINHNPISTNCNLRMNPAKLVKITEEDYTWHKIEFDVMADHANAAYLRLLCYHSPEVAAAGNVLCNDFNVMEIPLEEAQLNQAPVLNPIGNKTVTVGQQMQLTIQALDEPNTPLTFSVTYPGSTTPSNLPTNNGNSAIFVWTPTQTGSYNFTFKVSDGILSDSETVQIKVTLPPPVRKPGPAPLSVVK